MRVALGDLAISTAFVEPEHGIPLERLEKLFFLCVSIPEYYQIEKKMPVDYFMAERNAEQTIGESRWSI